MKALSKYIAATAVVSLFALSAGLANAQTATDAPKPAPSAEAPKPADAPKPAATTDAAKPAPAADTQQMKPGRDPAKWQARHVKMIDRLFAKYDPQHTGTITVEAFLKSADDRFDKIDTKHQGFIDKDELAASLGAQKAPMVDRIMKRLDTNADGKITKDEFEKPLRKRFALLDLNDDGKITREEADLAGPASMMGPNHPHRDGMRRHQKHDVNGQTQQ